MSAPASSRRERQRAQTREEIKAAARSQMAERGAAELSLSAVARALGLSTPALYHYFPDRDALLTDLIVDAFSGLAEALEGSVRPYPAAAYADRLLAALLSYRGWAIAHPVDFQLIYGSPVPGYHAPADRTVPAVRRGFAVMLGTLQAAHAAGALRPRPEHSSFPAELHFPMTAQPTDSVPPVDPAVAYIAIGAWALIHGMIMLELFHHLQPNLSSAELFYRHQVQTFLAGIGLG